MANPEVPLIPNQPPWYEWKQHPMTQEFLALLRQSVVASQQAWAAGEYLSEEIEKMAMINVAAVATTQLLDKMVWTIENIKYSDGENDAKP